MPLVQPPPAEPTPAEQQRVELVPPSEYDALMAQVAARDAYRTLMLRFTLQQRRHEDRVYRVCLPSGATAVLVETQTRSQCFFCTFGGADSDTEQAAATLLRGVSRANERHFAGLIPRDAEIVAKHYPVPTFTHPPDYAWHYAGSEADAAAALATPTMDTERFRWRRLTADDAALVNARWPHAGPGGALQYIRDLATRAAPACSSSFGGWGIVDTRAEGGERLVAWGLQYESGEVGFVHVEPDLRRCGLGRMVARKLTSCAFEQKSGFPPFIYTVASNDKGNGLFAHEGYVNDGPVLWVSTLGLVHG